MEVHGSVCRSSSMKCGPQEETFCDLDVLTHPQDSHRRVVLH